MGCNISKFGCPDFDYARMHILFPQISELFPVCQFACSSFVKRCPDRRNFIMYLFVYPTSRSAPGMDVGFFDIFPERVHNLYFEFAWCRSFSIDIDPASTYTGLYYHILFLQVSAFKTNTMADRRSRQHLFLSNNPNDSLT